MVLAGVVCAALVAWAADGVQPVPWSADRPLTWADYLGVPEADASATVGARTRILLNYRYQYVTEFDAASKRYCSRVYAPAVQVACMIDPLSSWVRPDARTDRLLNHEQRHFDLAQVYARKIQAAISVVLAHGATASAAQGALTAQVQSTAAQVNSAWHEVDGEYDQETGGGTNPVAQQQWDQRIDSWLANPSAAP